MYNYFFQTLTPSDIKRKDTHNTQTFVDICIEYENVELEKMIFKSGYGILWRRECCFKTQFNSWKICPDPTNNETFEMWNVENFINL